MAHGIFTNIGKMLCAALCCATIGTGVAAADKPMRIVTMSLCTDQLVLMLADPERIASVHWLTQDPNDSALWEQARKHPANHGLAEEILRLKPDLVIGGGYNSPFAVGSLRRLGVEVLIVQDANNFEGIRANIRLIAAVLKEEARGEALIDAFDRSLAQSRGALAVRNLRGLVYGSGGYSAGPPSLFDEVLTHLGIANLAAGDSSGSWIRMPLEDLVRAKPDVLFLGHYRPDSPSRAATVLAHPAIDRALKGGRRLHIPTNLWNCGTPVVAEAAEAIIERLRQARAGGGDG